MYVYAPNQTVKTYPYSIRQLRKDNPQVSFPTTLSNARLAEWDIYPLAAVEQPVYDHLTQRCVEVTPAQAEGIWTQQWVVENKPQDEAERSIRNRRNDLLVDSDWWAVQDRTMSQAEKDYRQALRDITDQPTFPDSVVWPTKPE